MDMAEGILPLNEQMPNEKYQVNDRIRVYITDVKDYKGSSDYRFQDPSRFDKKVIRKGSIRDYSR